MRQLARNNVKKCITDKFAAGEKVDYAIAKGGLDANWSTARKIPTVSLGCGQHAIHTADEWLDLDVFHRARQITLRLATVTTNSE